MEAEVDLDVVIGIAVQNRHNNKALVLGIITNIREEKDFVVIRSSSRILASRIRGKVINFVRMKGELQASRFTSQLINRSKIRICNSRVIKLAFGKIRMMVTMRLW